MGSDTIGPPVHCEAVDPRKTFLRRHIVQEFRRTNDLLGLELIRQRIRQAYAATRKGGGSAAAWRAFEARLDGSKWLLPHTFFYTRAADLLVYHDVPVVRVSDRAPYWSLTALLRKWREKPGVVLRARSGAGKTVACRRAFFDCFFRGHRAVSGRWEDEEDLFGCVPCWLNLAELPLTDELLEHVDDCVPWLLLEAAWHEEVPNAALGLRPRATFAGHREGATRQWLSRIRGWLQAGPPLLIFCDLNVLLPDRRQAFAQALNAFTRNFGQYGHRCVVTYRSTEANDRVANTLHELFEPFDLNPLPRHRAASYIGNFRHYEAAAAVDVRDLFSFPCPTPEDIEATKSKTLELIDRYARGSESLISTPLLMHFVAQIDPLRFPHVRSLAEVYREVIHSHLSRDQQLYSEDIPATLQGDNGVKRIRVALTRLGLALHAKEVTRFSSTDLNYLLANAASGGEFWRPNDGEGLWSNLAPISVPYYSERFSPEEIDSLRGFSLLRVEGNQVGYLHDSMIDYFTGAAALGDCEGPDSPPPCRSAAGPSHVRQLPDAWYRAVALLLRSKPKNWQRAAGYLAGTLTCAELRRLLKELLLQDSDTSWVELFLQVLRGRPALRDAVVDAIEIAILRRGSWVRKEPATLIEIVFDDLRGDLPRMDR